MKIKLKELAFIKTGLVLSRRKAKIQLNSESYQVVSLKSFNKNGEYNYKFSESFYSSRIIKEEYLVKKGDILIRLRKPNLAIYIDKDYEKLIASSLVAILRVRKDINPLFLTYYLNSKRVERDLNRYVKGTAIPMIQIKDISNLVISIPSLDEQKLLSLQNREITLLENLIDEKRKLNEALFERITK